MSERNHICFTAADTDKLVNRRAQITLARAARQRRSAAIRRRIMRHYRLVPHSRHRTPAEQTELLRRYARANGWSVTSADRIIVRPSGSAHVGQFSRMVQGWMDTQTLRKLKEVNEYAD